jgi:hypothetical protein
MNCRSSGYRLTLLGLGQGLRATARDWVAWGSWPIQTGAETTQRFQAWGRMTARPRTFPWRRCS